MRIIHTSDWHLGRRLHSVDLTEHHRSFLGWLVAESVDQRADAVVVAGDVFDRTLPPADAVELLDEALAGFIEAGIPVILTAGNHDSPTRLKYGRQAFAAAGIHFRTGLSALRDPVVLADQDGPVAIYGLPYLHPDEVVEELAAERSHTSVLTAAMGAVREDAAERGIDRVVVAAHAFITGAAVSDSEREIRVGGVGDAPAHVFEGVSFVALGHLHGPQEVPLTGSDTVLSYSGSPLAFSFSEGRHNKSISVVDIDSAGAAQLSRVPVPQPRALVQLRGSLADVLAGVTDDHREAWVKVTLTDPGRVEAPMARLREEMPHTLVLEFAPDVSEDSAVAPAALSRAAQPAEIMSRFLEHVTGSPPDERANKIIESAVEATQREDRA